MKLDKHRLKIIIAMLTWGSIGVAVREIDMSSTEIAFFRAIIGGTFLFVLNLFIREEVDPISLKKNLPILIGSGAALGTGWILLFQGYKYTTISNSTLSYYVAPLFITILSIVILKEEITLRKILGMAGAMIGLILIIGTEDTNIGDYNHIQGILFSLAAAVFYAIIVILNKFIEDVPPFSVTMIQLFVASIVLLPFIIFGSTLDLAAVGRRSWLALLIVGIIHTGLCYLLYFPSIGKVDAQSVGVLGYFDPVSALIIARIFLGEYMGLKQVLGGILILGSTLYSQIQKDDIRTEIEGICNE